MQIEALHCSAQCIKYSPQFYIGELQFILKISLGTTTNVVLELKLERDQIFALREITEKFIEYNTDANFLFVDFKQTFSSIIRETLMQALREMRIPQKLINMAAITIHRTVGRIMLRNKTGHLFEIKTGVKQAFP